MAKVVVTPLRDVRVTAALGADPVLAIGDQSIIDFQAIRIVLLLAIALRNPFPHLATRCGVTRANREAEYLSRLIRPRKPNPLLVLLTSHESPHLIALHGVSPAFRLLASLVGRQDAGFKLGERLPYFLRRYRRFEAHI
jgi:hypothetical protein